MPGITITPGTAWSVRPLVETTRPMAWPLPVKSLGRRLPDHFQTRHASNVVAVPVAAGETIAIEEHRYLEAPEILTPDIGFIWPYIADAFINYPEYSASASIQIAGGRYHDDGIYAAAWTPRRFTIDVPSVPKTTWLSHTWDLDYSLEVDGFRAHKLPWIKWPAVTCALEGWPDSVVAGPLDVAMLEEQAPNWFIAPDPGAPEAEDTADFASRLMSFYAAESSGWADSNANTVFRELISMTLFLTCNVNWTRVSDGSAPVTPAKEYLDLTGSLVNQTLYHKSVAFPNTPELALPAVTYYTRKCWAGGGALTFPES